LSQAEDTRSEADGDLSQAEDTRSGADGDKEKDFSLLSLLEMTLIKCHFERM